MSQVTINGIFEVIRSICKDYNFHGPPSTADNNQLLEAYIQTLEVVRIQLGKFRKLEEQYLKLQRLLQKSETEIRKHIGVESQMRLYIEALKHENDQLQKEKLELLDTTKVYIKQLKKENEKLFAELTNQINKNKTDKTVNYETMEKSHKKLVKEKMADISKSLNKAKTKRDKSLKEIVKTECIERQKFNTETKRQRKIHHYKLHSSIMSDNQRDNHLLEQNLRTYQEYNAISIPNAKNHHNQELAKANIHLISNQTLTNFFDDSKVISKRTDRQKIGKTPQKTERKDPSNKNKPDNPSRHLSRERKHNRSVYSVLSAEQSQNQKEIF